MNDINNLGSFSSIDAVWAKYPEGGKEGDFLTIGGVKHRWNKYDQIWENANTVTSSTARKLETVEGDLSVNNDLIVGGVLRAKAVKQPNCGLFESLSALQAKYPNPEVGMWATVGNTIPATVYLCAEEGVWKNTGQTGGIDSLDWSRISTIESNVTTLQQENTNRKTEIAKIDSSLRTLIATTVGKKLKFAPFAGFVSNVEIIKAGTSQWNNIVWDTVHKKFLARVLAPSDGGLQHPQFYESWNNQNDYTDDFETPTQYSIFHNTLTGDIYRYDGTNLVSLGITAERFNELSEKIKELLSLGADPNYKQNYNRTLIQDISSYAKLSQDELEVVKILIDAGCDIDNQDVHGNTALLNGVNNLQLVKLLLNSGADPNIANKMGDTPLSKCNKVTIKKLLVANGAVE